MKWPEHNQGCYGVEKKGKLVFVSGGVRSGKSTFAERFVMNASNELLGSMHYVATGQPLDAEMNERIKRHQEDRKIGPFIWHTWEQPRQIGKLAAEFEKKDVVLLDCLTTLLSNELFHQFDRIQSDEYQNEVFSSILTGIELLQKSAGVVVVVSNDLFQDVLPANDHVQIYAKMLGKLSREIVAQAHEAYLVEFSIPICMKGRGF